MHRKQQFRAAVPQGFSCHPDGHAQQYCLQNSLECFRGCVIKKQGAFSLRCFPLRLVWEAAVASGALHSSGAAAVALH
jgi:hypothetical protein